MWSTVLLESSPIALGRDVFIQKCGLEPGGLQPKIKSSITKAVHAAAGKPGAIAQARAAGHKEGVLNYTVAEMDLINDVVRLFLPSGFGAWERVEPEYNRMAAEHGFLS